MSFTHNICRRLGVIALATAFTASAVFSAQTPSPRTDSGERLKRITDWSIQIDERAGLTALREYRLDFPAMKSPDEGLEAAMVASRHPDLDYNVSADQFEQAALAILKRFGPGKTPNATDFKPKDADNGYSNQVWSKSFLAADVDGDGSQDILLAASDFWHTYGDGVCCLFRHTKQGWVAHRLIAGASILGMWIYDIARGGPKAIQIATLAGSEYDPEIMIDVFVWRKGRLNSALSTTIPHGFQFEHKDIDGTGTQSILLYCDATSDYYERRLIARTIRTYKWNGSQFTLAKTERPSVKRTRRELAQDGERLLESNRYQEAATTLQAALTGTSSQPQQDSYDYESATNWYELGLCYALLGKQDEAVTAMTHVNKGRIAIDPFSRLSREFLAACQRPDDLPKALAAVGQVFRVIELTATQSRLQSEPKAILAASGVTVDSYQELDLTGSGRRDGLAQIHWQGGSAVIAWLRNAQEAAYTLWPLAYGLETKPPEPVWWFHLPSFYLPGTPALQLAPVAKEVTLRGVRQGKGRIPQIVIAYRQGDKSQEGVIAWDGERFAMTPPLPQSGETILMQLNRVEEELMARRAYRETLASLSAIEPRVRALPKFDLDKDDWLMEIRYYRAICYRKLGQTQKARAEYATVKPEGKMSDWGESAAWKKLAEMWTSDNPPASPPKTNETNGVNP